MHMGASGKGFREGSNESIDQIMAELVNEETVGLCYRAFQINDHSLSLTAAASGDFLRMNKISSFPYW